MSAIIEAEKRRWAEVWDHPGEYDAMLSFRAGEQPGAIVPICNRWLGINCPACGCRYLAPFRVDLGVALLPGEADVRDLADLSAHWRLTRAFCCVHGCGYQGRAGYASWRSVAPRRSASTSRFPDWYDRRGWSTVMHFRDGRPAFLDVRSLRAALGGDGLDGWDDVERMALQR